MVLNKKTGSKSKSKFETDLPPARHEVIQKGFDFPNSEDELEFLDFEEITNSEQIDSIVDFKKERQSNIPKIKRKLKESSIETFSCLESFNFDSPWSKFQLHPILQHSLLKLGFSNPTSIQNNTLSRLVTGIESHTEFAILDSKIDIIGTAPTGSGKTLAFGLPILHSILCQKQSGIDLKISALILVPTRELGLQVEQHLLDIIRNSSIPVRIVTLIGGIAIPKQERLLGKQIDILIATPGRLSKFIDSDQGSDKSLRERLGEIQFLVLDEVDRMTEEHHFKELKSIFNTILISQISFQTFVFSATVKRDSNDWMKRIPFQMNKDSRIYITHDDTVTGISSSLPVQDIKEYKIKCTVEERDMFLYYFLLEHHGKVLIFVNSVDAIRHIVPILQLLNINNVWGIHSQMPQRQRLKNLDRFKNMNDNESCVLVATDVAGRGLDIPQVSYVLHYHIPRSLDIYIHRTGRTGRAGRKGTSLLLIVPQDQIIFDKWNNLNNIQLYDYDHHIWRQLNERMTLAKELEKYQYKISKKERNESWIRKAELALELDYSSNSRDSNEQKQIKILKERLDNLLSQPLLPKGFSTSFLTKPSNMNHLIYKKLIKSK